MKLLILSILLLFVSCTDKPVVSEPQPNPPSTPVQVDPPQEEEVNLDGAKKMSLWATFYYMKEVEPAVSGGVPLRNMNDQVIGPRLNEKTWCLGAIEGTVRVDGTTYNYAGTKLPRQADCSHRASEKVRWKVSKYEYGIGNRNNPLIPFKSIAVDTSVIPSGSKIYIPAAKGVKYSFEGEELTHDGVFFADDVGGAIKDNHIDVFLGSVTGGLEGALKLNPFDFIKSSSSKTFDAYLLK